MVNKLNLVSLKKMFYERLSLLFTGCKKKTRVDIIYQRKAMYKKSSWTLFFRGFPKDSLTHAELLDPGGRGLNAG